MFGLSAGHLIVLGIVVLLFGSKRLPELGAGLGQTFRSFKEAVEGREEPRDDKRIAGRDGAPAELVSQSKKT